MAIVQLSDQSGRSVLIDFDGGNPMLQLRVRDDEYPTLLWFGVGALAVGGMVAYWHSRQGQLNRRKRLPRLKNHGAT